MRQEAEPLPEKSFDLGGRESIADRLQPARVLARKDAVVEGLVNDTLQFQLALHVLLPVQAKLVGVGEVGTELEKERSKSRSIQ